MIFNLSPNISESGFISFEKKLLENEFIFKEISESEDFFDHIEEYSTIYSSLFQNIFFIKSAGYKSTFFAEKISTYKYKVFDDIEIDKMQYIFLQFYTAFKLIFKYNLKFYDLSKFQISSDFKVKFSISMNMISMKKNFKSLINIFKSFKTFTKDNIEKYFISIKDSYSYDPENVFFYKFSKFSNNILGKKWFEEFRGLGSFSVNIKIENYVQKQFRKLNILNSLRDKNILAVKIDNNIGEIIPYLNRIFSIEEEYGKNDREEIIDKIDLFIKGSQFSSFIFLIDKTIDQEESEFFNILLNKCKSGVFLISLMENKNINFDIVLNEEITNEISKYINCKNSVQKFLNEEEINILKTIKSYPIKYEDSKHVFKEKNSKINSLIENRVLSLKYNRLYIENDYYDLIKISKKESLNILNGLRKNFNLEEIDFTFYILSENIKGIREKLDIYINRCKDCRINKLGFIGREIENKFLKIGSYKKLAMRSLLFMIMNGDFERVEKIIEDNFRYNSSVYLTGKFILSFLNEDHKKEKELYKQVEKDKKIFSNDKFIFLKALHRVIQCEGEKGVEISKDLISEELKYYFKVLYSINVLKNTVITETKSYKKKMEPVSAFLKNSGWWIGKCLTEYSDLVLKFLEGNHTDSIKGLKKLFFKISSRHFYLLTGIVSEKLGDEYFFCSDFAQSEYWYGKAKKIFLDSGNICASKGVDFKFSDILIIEGKWSEVEKAIKDKISDDERNRSEIELVEDYFKLGKFEFLKRNYSESIDLFDKALEIYHNITIYEKSSIVEHLKIFKVIVSINKNINNLKVVKIAELKDKKYLRIEKFINNLVNDGKSNEKEFFKIIDQIEPEFERFIFLTSMYPFVDRDVFLKKMRLCFKNLDNGSKNFFYYELRYFKFLDKDANYEIEKVSILSDFENMYYYFTSRGRKIDTKIDVLKKYFENNRHKKQILKSVNLFKSFKRWREPNDFFRSFSEELRKNLSYDLISLKIFDLETDIFSFSENNNYKNLLNEIFRLTKLNKEDINMSFNEIQNEFESNEKSFYKFKITKSFFWNISGRYSGILILGWINKEKIEESEENKIRRNMLEFSELFEKFYEDVYCVNKKLGNIIGESDAILDLKRKIGRVSKVDFSLLITGESGSGKELVARAVHLLSRRENGKFVPVNAASIPENLIESELFGYARGAFTDAKTDKAGLVEEADEGTLFLDEIGELPLHLQAKLLRVIQENEIKRVGENRIRRVNVRFIFASNRNLKDMINEGKFREDLFYRIQDIVIDVPSLRERVEDIPLLTKYFFKKYSFKTNDNKFIEETVKKFEMREWKGNVRELESAVKRIITFYPDYNSLGSVNRSSENSNGLINKRMSFEKKIIFETLKKNRWNKTKSAKELKISRTYLFDLINRYDISKREIG